MCYFWNRYIKAHYGAVRIKKIKKNLIRVFFKLFENK